MKKWSILAAIALVAVCLTFVTTKTKSQSFSKHYYIRLYSGDKVVGEWHAREIGRVEGEALTFTVGDDLYPRMVRIQGTYAVEELQ